MARVLIDCVRLDGPDPDYRIDQLGGPQPSGEGRWKLSLDDVIKLIQTGQHTFYTNVGWQDANVDVYQHPVSRRLYLATAADGYPPNNLLNLARCP